MIIIDPLITKKHLKNISKIEETKVKSQIEPKKSQKEPQKSQKEPPFLCYICNSKLHLW